MNRTLRLIAKSTLALAVAVAMMGITAQAHAATSTPAQAQGSIGTLAWTCGSWAEILPPAVWGRSCRNSAPAQGAGQAYNGRSYSVRLRITVKTRTPWGDLNLGSCDNWVAPGTYFWCGDFYLGEGIKQYPVVATFQQLQP